MPPENVAAGESAPRAVSRRATAPWIWLAAVVFGTLALVAAIAAGADAPELFALLDRPGRGAEARRLLLAGAGVLAALALAVGAAGARARVTRGARALHPASGVFLLRLSAYLAALVLVAAHLADGAGRLADWPVVATTVEAAAWLGSLLLLACLLLARPARLAPPARRWARAADLAAFNTLALAVALETALAVVPLLSDSPLLQFDPILAPAEARRADETLRRFRLRSGIRYHDGTTNSRGYVDDEFFAAGPDDFVAAVIADSFGVGIVPPRHNFVAEVERRLRAALADRYRRVAAHNFGVSAAGFPEYRRILETEALATRPAVVVLCVFVGNDLFRTPHAPGLASYGALRNWRTFQLAVRLDRLAAERGVGVLPRWRRPAPAGRLPTPGTLATDETTPRRPHRLYLDIERQRLEVCNTAGRRAALEYREAREALRAIRELAGGRLLVALVPDEFQVNDALWDELMSLSATPAAYDRMLPQRRLLADCRDLGVPAVDLLPALAEAQRGAPTYRPDDSHWNRLGNAVAGAAIADAILATFAP